MTQIKGGNCESCSPSLPFLPVSIKDKTGQKTNGEAEHSAADPTGEEGRVLASGMPGALPGICGGSSRADMSGEWTSILTQEVLCCPLPSFLILLGKKP